MTHTSQSESEIIAEIEHEIPLYAISLISRPNFGSKRVPHVSKSKLQDYKNTQICLVLVSEYSKSLSNIQVNPDMSLKTRGG